MAFHPDHHYLDPVTGFQRHKHTHHLVGIEAAPPAKHPEHGAEFPKWVKPHHNHGVGELIVHSKEEEAHALADPHAEAEAIKTAPMGA